MNDGERTRSGESFIMTPAQIADALVLASTSASAAAGTRPLDRTRLQLSAALAPFTTFRIGGPADVIYEAQNADELAAAITAARGVRAPASR